MTPAVFMTQEYFKSQTAKEGNLQPTDLKT